MEFDTIKLRQYLNKVIIRFENKETFTGFIKFIDKRSFRWYDPDYPLEKTLTLYEDPMCIMFNDESEIRSAGSYLRYDKHFKRFKREYGHNIPVIEYAQFKKDIVINCQKDK